jgi:hypothetical protein
MGRARPGLRAETQPSQAASAWQTTVSTRAILPAGRPSSQGHSACRKTLQPGPFCLERVIEKGPSSRAGAQPVESIAPYPSAALANGPVKARAKPRPQTARRQCC